MRQVIRISLLLIIIFFVCSCVGNRRLIGKSRTQYGRVKFYEVRASGDKNSVSKVYALADSNNIKKYYTFYPNWIVMTDERAKGISYTVLFQQLPDIYDSNIYRKLSSLDTLVFSHAKAFLKKAEYAHLKPPEDAAGYQIEVYYLHGFPKNKKFRPL